MTGNLSNRIEMKNSSGEIRGNDIAALANALVDVENSPHLAGEKLLGE